MGQSNGRILIGAFECNGRIGVLCDYDVKIYKISLIELFDFVKILKNLKLLRTSLNFSQS